MKKLTFILLLSMVTVLSAEAQKYGNRNSNITISIQSFYDDLSPYGEWMYTSDFGYVWRPYFDNPEAFRPYSSNGHWVNTIYGWTWVSDYSWGWATFHYGRWDFDQYLGWMWIPGYEWAPAWVSWGYYGNYYGWAPLGPNVYASSVSDWYAPDPWWTFVPRNRFCSDNWNNYIYDRPIHITNITHITNVYAYNDDRNSHNSWYYGPRVSEVERYSRSKVRTMDVFDSRRSDYTGVKNDRLNVYRPSVDNRRGDSRPSEFSSVDQVRNTNRVQRTNASTNDPGLNRSRESRIVSGSTKQGNGQRTINTNGNGRFDQSTSTQSSNTRSNEGNRVGRISSSTSTQSGSSNTNGTRETKVIQNSGSQMPASRTTSQPSTETKRVVNERNTGATERVNSSTGSTRTKSPVNVQPRNSTPARENGASSSSRSTETRQAPSIPQKSDQRTQSAAPASNSRVENSGRSQSSTGEVRRSETQSSGRISSGSSTDSPTHR